MTELQRSFEGQWGAGLRPVVDRRRFLALVGATLAATECSRVPVVAPMTTGLTVSGLGTPQTPPPPPAFVDFPERQSLLGAPFAERLGSKEQPEDVLVTFETPTTIRVGDRVFHVHAVTVCGTRYGKQDVIPQLGKTVEDAVDTLGRSGQTLVLGASAVQARLKSSDLSLLIAQLRSATPGQPCAVDLRPDLYLNKIQPIGVPYACTIEFTEEPSPASLKPERPDIERIDPARIGS
jgi:hypothetical protein